MSIDFTYQPTVTTEQYRRAAGTALLSVVAFAAVVFVPMIFLTGVARVVVFALLGAVAVYVWVVNERTLVAIGRPERNLAATMIAREYGFKPTDKQMRDLFTDGRAHTRDSANLHRLHYDGETISIESRPRPVKVTSGIAV